MADPTVIGSGTFVRGRVTGTGDLEIAGRIEGEVTCSGEVLVDSTGLVGAAISARRIVVRGAVRGDLVAEDAVILEAGARVVGDLRAPRIAIAPGGLVRGHVQTSGSQAPARARSAAAGATRSAAPSAAAKAATAAPATAATRANTPPAAIQVEKRHSPPPARSGTQSRAAGPPPPLVPALKKGTKALSKKR